MKHILSISTFAVLAALVAACSHAPPLVQYSVSNDGIPNLLTMTSSGTDEPQDFRYLYAKATDICAQTVQQKARVVSSNGSCEKGHCYYSMAFRCRETTQ